MLPRRRRWISASLASGAAVAVLAGATLPAAGSPVLAGFPVAAGSPVAARLRPAAVAPSLSTYATQTLTWRACFNRRTESGLPTTYYRLECTNLTAPLDWAAPDGQTVTIAVSRLRTTKKPARGVLFTNPGGPGAAGVQLPLVLVDAGRRTLLRSQDVYGIDVRGAGESTNASCGSAAGLGVDASDRSPDNVDLMLDSAQLVARACDVAGGTVLDHVDTAQTVRDLELLRSLIDAPTINWLGYSAGTWLGANYATAFPERVGHMVLDSNVDFTGTWQDEFEAQPAGFERRFEDDFVPWVAEADTVWKLGSTPAAVLAEYRRIRSRLDPRLPVESPTDLDRLIAGAMYTKDLFPLAAFVLSDLKTTVDGRVGASAVSGPAAVSAASARLAAELPILRRSVPAPFSADAEDASFLAVTCNDARWTGGRAGLVTTSARLGHDDPLIGWATINQPCAFWRAPSGSLPRPTPTGAGVPPVLMVQSEHDPATPIEGARRAAAAFAGAHLLTVTGEGDHAVYASGNACVDRAVERFITSGVLPGAPSCPGRPLPDPRELATGSSARMGTLSTAGTRSVPTAPLNPLLALRRLTGRT
jgi:pimeloyl-ACP methyl ester carboxylesterase